MIHVWTVLVFFLSRTNVYSRSRLRTDKADSKRHLITAKSVAAPHLTAVNNYRDWLSFSPPLTGEGSHAANSQHQAVMWFVWFPLNASCPVSFLIFNCFDGSSEIQPFPIRKYRPLLPSSVCLLVFFTKYPLSPLVILGFLLFFFP